MTRRGIQYQRCVRASLYSVGIPTRIQELLERESEALITLASSSQRLLPIVVSGLSEQLSTLQKVRSSLVFYCRFTPDPPPPTKKIQPTTDEAQYKHARSERFLLDLLRKCLAAQWNQIVRISLYGTVFFF